MDTLFDMDAPRARHTDPVTAHRAARRMAPAAPALEAQILDLLGQRPRGFTKDQVCLKLGIDPRRWPSVASRLSGLKAAGKLKWADEPIGGMNVWVLVEQPVEVTGDAL